MTGGQVAALVPFLDLWSTVPSAGRSAFAGRGEERVRPGRSTTANTSKLQEAGSGAVEIGKEELENHPVETFGCLGERPAQ